MNNISSVSVFMKNYIQFEIMNFEELQARINPKHIKLRQVLLYNLLFYRSNEEIRHSNPRAHKAWWFYDGSKA